MKRQAGLSLVELMIGLLVSLILLAGVIQIFISARASSEVQAGVAEMQENARFLYGFIGKHIAQAGYRNPFESYGGRQAGFDGLFDNCEGSVPLFGEQGQSDSIHVCLYPGSGDDGLDITDCLGGGANNDGLVQSRFFLSNDGSLSCANGSGQVESLVGGVQSMEIEYLGKDGLIGTASSVGDWAEVTGVRFHFDLVPTSGSALVDDLEQTITFTVALRNLR